MSDRSFFADLQTFERMAHSYEWQICTTEMLYKLQISLKAISTQISEEISSRS